MLWTLCCENALWRCCVATLGAGEKAIPSAGERAVYQRRTDKFRDADGERTNGRADKQVAV
jgi:hypothetical protein